MRYFSHYWKKSGCKKKITLKSLSVYLKTSFFLQIIVDELTTFNVSDMVMIWFIFTNHAKLFTQVHDVSYFINVETMDAEKWFQITSYQKRVILFSFKVFVKSINNFWIFFFVKLIFSTTFWWKNGLQINKLWNKFY